MGSIFRNDGNALMSGTIPWTFEVRHAGGVLCDIELVISFDVLTFSAASTYGNMGELVEFHFTDIECEVLKRRSEDDQASLTGNPWVEELVPAPQWLRDAFSDMSDRTYERIAADISEWAQRECYSAREEAAARRAEQRRYERLCGE